MYLINGITDAPKQRQTLILPNTKSCTLYLEYKPLQLGWFMSLKYFDFEVNNLRVVTSGNILNQFKNLIPFGVACFVDELQEPLLKTDFLLARAKLYILDSDEVELFEAFLSG